VQNYVYVADGAGGRVGWRADDAIPPASRFISSPHDGDAHYARKRSTQWVGYRVHVTETCEDETPCLVTQVETTPAPVADGDATPTIHADLSARDSLPGTHIVDTGYLDAELLVTSRERYGVDLLGPTRRNDHWQARAGEGYSAEHFGIDWAAQQATCPQGRTSISWTPAVDGRRNDVVKITFSSTDCGRCAHRDRCVRSKKTYVRRTLTVRPQWSEPL
jgi:transposase